MWRGTDATASWTFPGCEGRKAEIEVYSPGTYVELFQDGESLGKKRLEYAKAKYTITYKKGTLIAVSYDEAGNKTDSCTLVSAGDNTKLTLRPDKTEMKADNEDMV